MTDKTKGPSLLEQLQAVSGKAGSPTQSDAGANDGVAPSRRGKKAITIWVDPLVAEQLKEIAFRHKKPQQALYLEALNILFAKYGLHEIA
jgi:Antitoxin-like ribbon-helix-helix